MLPSVLPKLGTDSAVRRFPDVWKLLSFFVVNIFSYLLSKSWVALLGA